MHTATKENNLHAQRTAERAKLKDDLERHIREDFSHPCVSLRMPVPAPVPLAAPSHSHALTRAEELQVLTQTISWVQSKKQGELWPSLITSDQQRLETWQELDHVRSVACESRWRTRYRFWSWVGVV